MLLVLFHIATLDFVSMSQDIIFNENGAAQMCFSEFINDDVISESCKSFTVSLSSNNERSIIPVSSIDVQLYDDDGKIYCFIQFCYTLQTLLFYNVCMLDVQFCFTGDTPHSNGTNLEIEYELNGCASLMCRTADTPLRDCKYIWKTSLNLGYSLIYK